GLGSRDAGEASLPKGRELSFLAEPCGKMAMARCFLGGRSGDRWRPNIARGYLHAPVTWLTNSKADKDLRLPQATAQLLLSSWEPLWRRSEEADLLRRWSPRGGRDRRHGCSCRCVGYMRNTPNLAGSIGALRDAETARPSTRRVSAGSMM